MMAMPTMMTTGNYEMKKVKGWHKKVTKDVVQAEYDALPKQALRSQSQLAKLMNIPLCTLNEWIRFGSIIVTETTTTNIAEFYKLKKRKTWDNYFQQLVDYYGKHKHTNVTKNCKEYQSIGWWITLQRTSYRKKKLSKDCVSRLESIGFVWDLQVVLSWYEKYNELKVFWKKHGHCDVPKRGGTQSTKVLGEWVLTQRKMKKKYDAGAKTEISVEKVRLLADINFPWSALGERWNEKFEELQKFKEKHGHCRVPIHSGKLGQWVENQRRSIKHSNIEDRIAKLHAIGLFDSSSGRSESDMRAQFNFRRHC